MRLYLLFTLLSMSTSLFGQPVPETNHRAEFTIKDITFRSAEVTLTGTIFKPKHPHAAIVLVHGSGQEKRMISLATSLAENGIAVFTYDKRGVGASGGVYAGPEAGTNNIDSVNLNLLASDASEASNTLLANLTVKGIPLGLMGFSQAGWVIPLAALKNHKVNFMILFSGPVVTTLEQLRFQFYTQGNSKFWETHTEEEVRVHVQNDPDRYQFEPTDPTNALAKLNIPGLWIFGGKDIQIPVGLSIENLDILRAQGKRYAYQLFPELGHNTFPSPTAKSFHAVLQWIKNYRQ